MELADQVMLAIGSAAALGLVGVIVVVSVDMIRRRLQRRANLKIIKRNEAAVQKLVVLSKPKVELKVVKPKTKAKRKKARK